MADNDKQKLTANERQIARIKQLKAQLQKEEAKLRADAKKERNAQLMAFGIYLERFLKDKTDQIPIVNCSIKKYLTGRTLEKGMVGLERVSKEVPAAQQKKEITPALPSQLPKSTAGEDGQSNS